MSITYVTVYVWTLLNGPLTSNASENASLCGRRLRGIPAKCVLMPSTRLEGVVIETSPDIVHPHLRYTMVLMLLQLMKMILVVLLGLTDESISTRAKLQRQNSIG